MAHPNEAHDLPLVSIGVPVFNEARYIADSLRSILDQDYPNIEIIISDNASTDGTSDICRQLAGRDSRVSFHVASKNLGSAENFGKVLELANGRYFMWASGHDLWSSNLISEGVRLLESCPEYIIAFGSSNWIDADGAEMSKFSGWTDTRGMDSVSRFYSVYWGNMHPILGLIRADILKRAYRKVDVVGGDLILLLGLVLQGHFVHATSAHWTRRQQRETETHAQRVKRYQSAEFGLARSLIDSFLPLIKLPFLIIATVVRAHTSWFVKLCILVTLLPALPVRYLAGRRRLP